MSILISGERILADQLEILIVKRSKECNIRIPNSSNVNLALDSSKPWLLGSVFLMTRAGG